MHTWFIHIQIKALSKLKSVGKVSTAIFYKIILNSVDGWNLKMSANFLSTCGLYFWLSCLSDFESEISFNFQTQHNALSLTVFSQEWCLFKQKFQKSLKINHMVVIFNAHCLSVDLSTKSFKASGIGTKSQKLLF